MAAPAPRWLHGSPGTFYACFFLRSYQVAVLFSVGRNPGRLLQDLISPHL